jgi:hypothetical protein
VFRILPWNREVLRGLLGADLVGFHVESYATNFLEACRGLPDVEVDLEARIVRAAGRATRVRAFPIGIDSQEFARLANDTEIRKQAKTIRRGIGVEKLMLGVDRLDYTKGIEQRLQAFDRLLEREPHLIGAVSLLQIAVPSRAAVPEYSAFKKRIDELVGRINGKHAQDGWQPIHCVYRTFSQRKLIAYYLAADVALVTPLRDGMNLIAKEFCAARVDCDGVLVLSEFAGAAECLAEKALVVNPFDLERFAETLSSALTMERQDRTERMRALRDIVSAYDIYDWLHDFLEQADRGNDAFPAPVEVLSSAGWHRTVPQVAWCLQHQGQTFRAEERSMSPTAGPKSARGGLATQQSQHVAGDIARVRVACEVHVGRRDLLGLCGTTERRVAAEASRVFVAALGGIERRPNRSRGDAIDSNTSIHGVLSQRLGECMNGAFRRRIVDEPATAFQARDGARIDDRAAFGHVGQGGADEIEGGENVRLEGPHPLLVGDLRDSGAMLLEGRIIDEDIDSAETRHDSFDRARAKRLVAHIARDQQSLSPLILDRVRRDTGVVLFFGEVDDSDIGPLASVKQGNGPADAGIPSRDERNSVAQFTGRAVARGSITRCRIHFRFVARRLDILRRERRTGLCVGRSHRRAFRKPVVNAHAIHVPGRAGRARLRRTPMKLQFSKRNPGIATDTPAEYRFDIKEY